ncbi:MAG TPA: YkgJ family cysteine cluster protein [Polyangia bacterium]|nr:YkgJ family cysteine cluster protein [Polyangia bacterium]
MKPRKKKAQAAAPARRHADGRVHLALHRDPVNGREQLTLDVPVFRNDWQNELVAAAANTAYAIVQGEPKVERAVELARNAMAAMSRLAEGLLASAPQGAVACKPGCDHCCHQSVGVTPPEALAIFEHLRHTLGEVERAALAAQLAVSEERTRGLSAAERFSPDHPCPFLAQGRCSIYEVRPLACRGMNSLSADECARRLRDPEARAAFLAQGVGGHSYLEPIRAVHAISAGLQVLLSEFYNLDMRPLELTSALHLLFESYDRVVPAWLDGAPAFAPAHGGDSTREPGSRDLTDALIPAVE